MLVQFKQRLFKIDFKNGMNGLTLQEFNKARFVGVFFGNPTYSENNLTVMETLE